MAGYFRICGIIGQCALSECESLESVTFESQSRLKRIEERAFAENGLNGISSPASVEIICEFAFSECESLESVTFESGSRLREVGRCRFSGSPSVGLVAFPQSILTDRPSQ
jgi:hypothetical protein